MVARMIKRRAVARVIGAPALAIWCVSIAVTGLTDFPGNVPALREPTVVYTSRGERPPSITGDVGLTEQ